jgi:hypothetical protein
MSFGAWLRDLTDLEGDAEEIRAMIMEACAARDLDPASAFIDPEDATDFVSAELDVTEGHSSALVGLIVLYNQQVEHESDDSDEEYHEEEEEDEEEDYDEEDDDEDEAEAMEEDN